MAKAYGVHPNSARAWRGHFLEKGPEVFAEDNIILENEKLLGPDQMSADLHIHILRMTT